MSEIIWIQNGRIIDPANERDEIADLYAVNGRIVSELNREQLSQATCYDASGCIVCPGLVDIQVHLREPGQSQKECVMSGSWAAAAGGITSMVCMGNTSPPCDNPGTLQYLSNVIKRDSVVNIYPVGTITLGLEGKALSPTGSLKKAGVVALTDDGHCVQNNEIMRRAVEYAHMHGLIVMDHCQDYSLTNQSVMNEGVISLKLGLRGWPNAAEDIIVARNIILSESTGAPIHLQHISSENSVEFIRRAKKRGVQVTAEAMPHHLSLTDEALASYDSNFKMNPPLRTEHDRQALIEGLLDGTIDCIATDHAPHTPTEKDVEFDLAPFGIIGLETSLSVCYRELVLNKKCNIYDLIRFMTCQASDILHLGKGTLSEGVDADIVIFDPEAKRKINKDGFFSRSQNSPWIGETLPVQVKKTFVAGKLIFDGENIVSAADEALILARPGTS